MGGESGNLPDFYYFPSSFYSQKALLALTEKQIPVNKHVVNIAQFKNYEAWFMKINPLGKVPTLVDDGKIITESTDIIKYCDETYEGPVMMPELGKERWEYFLNKCEEIKIECITYGSFIHQDLAANSRVPTLIRNKMKAKVLSGERTETVRRMLQENPEMKDVYEKKIRDSQALEEMMKDRELMLAELDKTKELLEEINDTIAANKQEWLCGAEITIADISLAILLQRLKMVGFSHFWESDKLPMVDAYYERLLYWKPFRDVCVQGSSPTGIMKFIMSNQATKIIPLFVAGAVLVLALGIGYFLYKKL